MFNEHGEFKVTLQGDKLLVVVTGAWNVETAKAYSDTVIDTIRPVKDKCWGLISDVREWELCSLDCELLIVKLSAQCREKGLKREAVVNNNIESVKLDLFHRHAKNHTPRTSLDAFQRRFFETDTEAKEWLKNEGYGL